MENKKKNKKIQPSKQPPKADQKKEMNTDLSVNSSPVCYADQPGIKPEYRIFPVDESEKD